MKTSRVILPVVLGIVVLLLAAGWGVRHIQDGQYAQWLERGVGEVRALAAHTNWMGDAIAAMRAHPDRHDDLGRYFMSPDLILMSNGEWIIYRAATHKQGARFPELFVGLASDQHWYYSTYHFCRQMIVLGADGQPDDLRYFVTNYCLRPYSGQPYHGLRKTWPPEE